MIGATALFRLGVLVAKSGRTIGQLGGTDALGVLVFITHEGCTDSMESKSRTRGVFRPYIGAKWLRKVFAQRG